jgi:hypothetical protein
MSGSSSRGPKARKRAADPEVRIDSLVDLLEQQDDAMRHLFAKALNLYVSPGADAVPEREKLDHLKRAIQESLTEGGASC